MVRMQIQLREDQYASLRRQAALEGRSLAGLVRESVDSWLAGAANADALSGLEELSGRFRDSTGAADVAERHDQYLTDQTDS